VVPLPGIFGGIAPCPFTACFLLRRELFKLPFSVGKYKMHGGSDSAAC